MNNGLLVLGQGNQCGSVGVWEASLFVRLPLAPPGSSLAPPWLRLAAPGSSWLLSFWLLLLSILLLPLLCVPGVRGPSCGPSTPA